MGKATPLTTRLRVLAVLQAAAAGAVLAACLWQPWLATRALGEDPYRDVGRTELLARDPIAYERILLDLPLAAAAAAVVASLVIARWPRGAPLVAARWVVAVASLALLACSSRWLGFYGARLWDPGPSLAHLHVVPYAQLAVGLVLAPQGWYAWRDRAGPATPRHVRRLSFVFALGLAGLLATPLVPYAVHAGGGFHYDELTLATVAATGGSAARGVAWALGGLAAASVALAALAVAGLGTWMTASRRALAWANVAVAVSMAGLSAWLLLQLASMPPALRLGPNFLHQAIALAAVGASLMGLVREPAAR